MTDEPLQGAGAEPAPAQGQWKRVALTLFCLVGFAVAEMLLWVTGIVQVVLILASGNANRRISAFGASLALWTAQAVRYASAASGAAPFPFAAWPEPSAEA